MVRRTPRRSTDDETAPHRADSLVLAFLGSFALKPKDSVVVPARIFLDVLGQLDVTEGATRTALARMVERGLLQREASGRNTLFAPSPSALALLAQGAERVSAPDPFDHDGRWTLLAFTMPESHRDLRHLLRARLLWAGLGPLRDGLWIAPGTLDVQPLLADLSLDSAEGDLPWAFVATPLPPTQLPLLIQRVWDLGLIRSEHQRFLTRWETRGPGDLGPMAARTLLVADWLRLLRRDPGLPAEALGPDWPARRSVAVFHDTLEKLRHPSDVDFAEALCHFGRTQRAQSSKGETGARLPARRDSDAS